MSGKRGRVARNADGVAGASICGSQGAPHCLRDSMATARHLSATRADSSASGRATLRSERMGTMRAAPSYVAFWMMRSMLLALAMAWIRVSR